MTFNNDHTQYWSVAWGRIESEPVGCTHWIPGHLAITGTPPVFSPSGKYGIVGDIWLSNRQFLLEQLPLQFKDRSGSDLEFVVTVWEILGIACLPSLQGNFAFVVWQVEGNRLWLVRDPVGSQTLYYTQTQSICWIAPKLKHLRPYHSDELDLVALRDYLCCAFVPGARTLWKQVRELRPGTLLECPDRIQTYWEPLEQIVDTDQSLVWYGEKLRHLLHQIIPEYLPSNEPVGVYLSGGIDSSCITALASQYHHHPVHTYSIHFGRDCPHELEFSQLVVNHCHTQHHILEITPEQMWQQLGITMAQLDDPIGDPLTVPNYLLGQLAHSNVKVILNGEGGDPCFGGPKNKPMLLNQLYQNLETPSSSDLLLTYLASFKKCAHDLPHLLKPEIWEEVKTQSSVFSPDLESEAEYLNRLMILNIKFKGADHILTKVNNLTYGANLQGLSPLFDQRLVELALQIPPYHKLAGAEEKAVLKQAVLDLLPSAIIYRPKSGMMVPVQQWFYHNWQRQTKGLLLSRRSLISPYLNQKLIEKWLNYQGDPWRRYGVKLWLLTSLERWLEVNLKP